MPATPKTPQYPFDDGPLSHISIETLLEEDGYTQFWLNQLKKHPSRAIIMLQGIQNDASKLNATFGQQQVENCKHKLEQGLIEGYREKNEIPHKDIKNYLINVFDKDIENSNSFKKEEILKKRPVEFDEFIDGLAKRFETMSGNYASIPAQIKSSDVISLQQPLYQNPEYASLVDIEPDPESTKNDKLNYATIDLKTIFNKRVEKLTEALANKDADERELTNFKKAMQIINEAINDTTSNVFQERLHEKLGVLIPVIKMKGTQFTRNKMLKDLYDLKYSRSEEDSKKLIELEMEVKNRFTQQKEQSLSLLIRSEANVITAIINILSICKNSDKPEMQEISKMAQPYFEKLTADLLNGKTESLLQTKQDLKTLKRYVIEKMWVLRPYLVQDHPLSNAINHSDKTLQYLLTGNMPLKDNTSGTLAEVHKQMYNDLKRIRNTLNKELLKRDPLRTLLSNWKNKFYDYCLPHLLHRHKLLSHKFDHGTYKLFDNPTIESAPKTDKISGKNLT